MPTTLSKAEPFSRRRRAIMAGVVLITIAGCSNSNATTADPNDVWRAVEHAELEANRVSARPGSDRVRP